MGFAYTQAAEDVQLDMKFVSDSCGLRGAVRDIHMTRGPRVKNRFALRCSSAPYNPYNHSNIVRLGSATMAQTTLIQILQDLGKGRLETLRILAV